MSREPENDVLIKLKAKISDILASPSLEYRGSNVGFIAMCEILQEQENRIQELERRINENT